MKIRKAVISDAPGIAKVHVDSWRTTYKNIIPEEFLKNLSYERRTKLWEQNIPRQGNYVYVAENEVGHVVGFGDCGKRETNQVEHSGDLTSIYLLKEYQGRGIGKELLKKLFHKCKELGYQRVFVEVLEENKTRYFYENYGAKLLKTEKIVMAGKELNLLIYEWMDVNEALSRF